MRVNASARFVMAAAVLVAASQIAYAEGTQYVAEDAVGLLDKPGGKKLATAELKAAVTTSEEQGEWIRVTITG